MSSPQDLFEEHAGIALSRQRDLADRVGEHAWSFDMGAGMMSFEKRGFLGFGKRARVGR